MSTISIHRALTLIAKSNENLSQSIARGIFISTVKGQSLRRPTDSSFKTEAELVTRIQSDTDKVESLLALIPRLKAAIAKKNLETKVQFGGKEVSITELLAIKSTLSQRQQYLNSVRQQTQRANQLVERQQQEIAQQVATNTSSVGDVGNYQRQLEQLNSIELVAVGKESAAAKIQRLIEENEFLSNELDYTLSEVNLSTLLELDFDLPA